MFLCKFELEVGRPDFLPGFLVLFSLFFFCHERAMGGDDFGVVVRRNKRKEKEKKGTRKRKKLKRQAEKTHKKKWTSEKKNGNGHSITATETTFSFSADVNGTSDVPKSITRLLFL